MPLLATLDVIIIPDDTITPPAPKMVVCIHPENGCFYRVNSKSHWRPCILLPKEPDHGFLDHDSYLQCGDPLELDDYVIEEAITRYGVIGKISAVHCEEIVACLDQALYLSDDDKAAIRRALT